MNDIIERILLAQANFMTATRKPPTHVYLGQQEYYEIVEETIFTGRQFGQALRCGQIFKVLNMDVVQTKRVNHLTCGYDAGCLGAVDTGGRRLRLVPDGYAKVCGCGNIYEPQLVKLEEREPPACDTE